MLVKSVVALVIAVLVAGCAQKHVLVVNAPVRPASDAKVRADAKAGTEAPAGDSLATFIEKFRKVSTEARPASQALRTLEAQDARLASAVAAAILTPSVDTYRTAAAEYRRLGVFDRAFQYLGRALALSPRDGTTFEALARLWRDAGMPAAALGDAHRAVYFAPASPAAHNTLGTVLQALGRRAMARTEYERALNLNPSAAFALNNLCYGWILDGARSQAIEACQRAIDLEPEMMAARNNLALAYALNGDVAAAEAAFKQGGDEATAFYNTGILHLARRDYRSALEAFQQALAKKPSMSLALARANQAAAVMARGGE